LDAGPTKMHGPNGSPVVTYKLRTTAEKLGIPFQMEINTQPASNDAKEMQLAAFGNAAGSVGIPLRNMHTQTEIASLTDLENTVQLLTEFVASLSADEDFLPLNYFGDNGNVGENFILDQIGSGVSK
jgi:endoglucanase